MPKLQSEVPNKVVKESVFGEFTARIEHGIHRILEKYAYSTRRRKLRAFKRFQALAKREYRYVCGKNVQQVLEHFRGHVYTHRGNNVTISADSDYRTFRALIADLVQINAFPACIPPLPLNSNSPLLNETKALNCLGTMDPRAWKTDNQNKSHTSLYAVSDQDYLDQFFDHQRDNRDEFVNLARQYIIEAANRFALGRKFISQTNPALFEDPDLLHPEAKSQHTGQRFSLFSSDLPNNEGLRNLVGFLHYKRDGLIERDFPGSNNHLYRYRGRRELSEYLGLSSDLAAACAVVIVDETGINSQSFYELNYDSDHRIITPHDSVDGYYFNYIKPRAGGFKNRLIPRGDHKINAEYCFELIFAMTHAHREISPQHVSRKLLIHDGCYLAGQIQIVSHTAIKSGLKRLIACSNSQSFIEGSPNLKKLRVSRGLLEWYTSGGNPRAASRYLGNRVDVTINNYIPKELQEFFYRKQIRQFQHLLIAVSTDEKPYQERALDIQSSEELANYLETQVQQSPLRSRIKATRMQVKEEGCEIESSLTFVLSIQNIAFLDAAKKNYLDGASSKRNLCLKKWARLCGLVFSYIQSKGTRSQKTLMAEGIALNNLSPLQL